MHGALKILLTAAALMTAGTLAYREYGHAHQEAKAEPLSRSADKPPNVRTGQAERMDGPVNLRLEGTQQAFDTPNIYARAPGYIAERRVDIDSRVKKGDLLVRIAAPDLDQQLAQAQAQVGQFQ